MNVRTYVRTYVYTHAHIYVSNTSCKYNIYVCMYNTCIYTHMHTHVSNTSNNIYVCMYNTYVYVCVCVKNMHQSTPDILYE